MAGKDDLNLGGDKAEEKSGGKSKLIIILLLVIILLGGGAAAFFLLSGDDAEAQSAEGGEAAPEVESREPYYAKMNKLLVNIDHQGRSRFVQVEMQLMSYTEEVVDQAYRDMPAIRDRLIMLLNQQDFAELKTPEGKDALRTASLEAVNEALGLTAPEAVDQVYFEGFVLQ